MYPLLNCEASFCLEAPAMALDGHAMRHVQYRYRCRQGVCNRMGKFLAASYEPKSQVIAMARQSTRGGEAHVHGAAGKGLCVAHGSRRKASQPIVVCILQRRPSNLWFLCVAQILRLRSVPERCMLPSPAFGLVISAHLQAALHPCSSSSIGPCASLPLYTCHIYSALVSLSGRDNIASSATSPSPKDQILPVRYRRQQRARPFISSCGYFAVLRMSEGKSASQTNTKLGSPCFVCAEEAAALLNCVSEKKYNEMRCYPLIKKLRACVEKKVTSIHNISSMVSLRLICTYLCMHKPAIMHPTVYLVHYILASLTSQQKCQLPGSCRARWLRLAGMQCNRADGALQHSQGLSSDVLSSAGRGGL